MVGTFYDTENLGIVDEFEVSKDKTGKKIYSDQNSQPYNKKYFSYPEENSWIFNNRIHLTGNDAYYDKTSLDE